MSRNKQSSAIGVALRLAAQVSTGSALRHGYDAGAKHVGALAVAFRTPCHAELAGAEAVKRAGEGA